MRYFLPVCANKKAPQVLAGLGAFERDDRAQQKRA